MKYYAIGETKVKVKDEKGKEQTVEKTVLITEDVVRSRPWTQRVIAQNEAQAYCKSNKIQLQGVYLAQGSLDHGGLMTKNIKGQKAKAHRFQEKKRRAR